jgi:hypothetical protein
VIATKLGWHPDHVITNSVSATDTFLTTAKQSGSDLTDGTLTVGYTLDPANPVYNKLPGMKLYRQIMAKYNAKANANDGLNLYGVAKAWTIVQALQAAGTKLTRDSFMNAARNMNLSAKAKTSNPFLLPGVDMFTKGGDQYVISQVTLITYRNNTFQPVGTLINGRGA